MASKGLRIAGLELVVRGNARALSITFSISSRIWAALFERLRKWVHNSKSADETKLEETQQAIPANATPQQKELLERIRGVGWYHSIDLGHTVITPGFFDHRPILHKYQLPERLDGLRALDAATFDGFWAFEFERRGADEVVALDLDCFADLDFPPKVRASMTAEQLQGKIGKGFAIAHELLRSKVRREVLSLYELSPERLGKFDLVHTGDVLLHLMNPMKALQNICSVTSGYALISDCYFPDLDRMDLGSVTQYLGGRSDCVWWRISLEALEQMILDAGFERVELITKFNYNSRGKAPTMHHVVFKAFPPVQPIGQSKP